jgi:hypothetical protein
MSCAGVMSAMGCPPMRGSNRLSSQRDFLIVTASRPSRDALSRYSSATALNVVAILSRAPISAKRFVSPGSWPSAMVQRASSRRRRASLRDTSGYTPNPSFFSFPEIRYFKRQSFPPDGCKRRNSPFSSASLIGFGPCFAFLIVVSVNVMWGPLLKLDQEWPPQWPPFRPDYGRTRTNHSDRLIQVSIEELKVFLPVANINEQENGARKRTRTSTTLRSPAPEAGASTNSAIRALG